MSKPTITVALIVKNEEKNLARCLEVLDWADEIVILDSGSTDNTKEVAEKFGARFYVNTDWPGFGKQRQIAQSYATCDWIFWIDADEIVTPELRDSIKNAIQNNSNNIAYSVNRLSSAFGKPIHHSGWSPDWIARLYRTNETKYNDALVHEKVLINPKTKIIKLSGKLLHNTYNDLHHYINKTTGYIKAWSDERDGIKHPKLGTALIHAFSIFFKMYFLKLGFLDGRHGFILAWLSMNSTFIKYIDLYLRDYTRHKK